MISCGSPCSQAQPNGPDGSTAIQGPLCFLPIGRKQDRGLGPACPSPLAHLHGIYTGSFHALMHTASSFPGLCLSLCRDKGGCSVPQVFSQRSILAPRAPPQERRKLLKSREARDLVQAIQAGPGLEPTLSLPAAPGTHSFLPFLHHGGGGLADGEALLLLCMAVSQENRQG